MSTLSGSEKIHAARSKALLLLNFAEQLAGAVRADSPGSGASTLRIMAETVRAYLSNKEAYGPAFGQLARVSRATVKQWGASGTSTTEWAIRWAVNLVTALIVKTKIGLLDKPTEDQLRERWPELKQQLAGLAPLSHVDVDGLITEVEWEFFKVSEKLAETEAKPKGLPPSLDKVGCVTITQTPPTKPGVFNPTITQSRPISACETAAPATPAVDVDRDIEATDQTRARDSAERLAELPLPPEPTHDMQTQAQPLQRTKSDESPDPPPTIKPKLTLTEKAVLVLIPIMESKGEGLTGQEIISMLKKQGFTIEKSTFYRHIAPKLKAHYSVINIPSRGGYLRTE